MVFPGSAAALPVTIARRQANLFLHPRHNHKDADRIGAVLVWQFAPVQLL